MITYRIYQPGDEKNIISLWNASLHIDPITATRFRNLVLLDANFDPQGLWLAFDGDEVVGCMYGVRRLLPMHGTDLEPDDGWIVFFFVHAQYRRKGVGTALLKEVMEFFLENDRKNIFFSSYAPNYIVPGIDKKAYADAHPFLQNHGFIDLYAPVAMDRSLVDYHMPADVIRLKHKREREGYTFEKVEEGDLYHLIQFANHTFNPDWGRAIREGILRGLPLERIIVAKEQNQIVGFCLYGAYEGVPERFGPFGVAPNQQGKGLGKILLHEALHHMRAEGLHGAWFLWTGEKTAAGHLYKRTGFHTTRQFQVMKKQLN